MNWPRHSIKTQEAFACFVCKQKSKLAKASDPETKKSRERKAYAPLSKETSDFVWETTPAGQKLRHLKNENGEVLNYKESFWRRTLRTWGGAGLVFSLVFHLILLAFAIFYITQSIVINVEEEPNAFVTGAGGGNDGASRERPRRAAKIDVQPKRIMAKNTAGTLVLPEIDMPSLSGFSKDGFGDFASGFGDMGSGSGGGSGGGIGSGKGVGIGDGKSFVSGFKIMGTTIKAQKLAVYLDCSPSMTPYLPAVKAEIYELFPDADIYEFNAIVTEVRDGELTGAKRSRVDKQAAVMAKKMGDDNTDEKKLSIAGRQIYKKYAPNFATGSVGAWLDVVLEGGYDGLIIFSDFEDGLRQWGRDGELLFADSRYHPKLDDDRKAKDLRWLERWLKVVKSRNNKPAVYCYTITREPQEHFRKLVELTGGEITDVSYLKRKKSSKKSKRSKKALSKSKMPVPEEPEFEIEDFDEDDDDDS
ncbi:MAG: hypothetical protein K6B46_04885 [Opitutales bacterium]|nr:hypothetical protein [Opitutales bacterium]